MVRSVKKRPERKTLADLRESHEQVTGEGKSLQDNGFSFNDCLCCGRKITEGYYGRFMDGGVCSKKCNDAFTENRRQEREAAAGTMTEGL